MSDLMKELNERANQFAIDNLHECANELLERYSTGILRNGKVRELAKMISVYADVPQTLAIAESMVNHAALSYVNYMMKHQK